MSATNWSRIFHLPVCYIKTYRLKYRQTVVFHFYGSEIWSLMRETKTKDVQEQTAKEKTLA